MNDDAELMEKAKEWYYSTHDKPSFFRRLYYSFKRRMAEWSCGCDTVRGDGAIMLEYKFEGLYDNEVAKETLIRARAVYQKYKEGRSPIRKRETDAEGDLGRN